MRINFEFFVLLCVGLALSVASTSGSFYLFFKFNRISFQLNNLSIDNLQLEKINENNNL